MYATNGTIERLRDAACLAHAVPGVAVRLTGGGREVLVSGACLAAELDPCRFRSLVIAASAVRLGPLARFDRIDVVGGLVHLGGGLYQASHPSTDDRWFVTTLGHEALVDMFGTCPLDATDAFSVVIKPDFELARCAVRVRCEQRSMSGQLDEIATWAMSTCLIEELVGGLPVTESRPDR